MTEPLRILFLSAEAAPLIKVGGLGDVAGSLPPALRQLNLQASGGRPLDVRLVIPYHGEIQKRLPDPELVADFLVNRPGGAVQARAYLTHVEGQPVYMIGGPLIPADAPVYSLDSEKDGEKFIFFSLAALELARKLNWQPDIIHANDWHTAIAVYRLKQLRRSDPFFENTRSLICVHNLPFMGTGVERALASFGIPPARSQKLPYWSRSFPLVMGMYAADKIVAVSPTYAQEIMTPEFGSGLQEYLTSRKNDISGILNGIDNEIWNPETDPLIIKRFNGQRLDNRQENKAALQDEVGLPVDSSIPLLILIGRMDPQKGVDLVVNSLMQATHLPWQVIFLGTGVPMLESAARSLETELPDRVRAVIRFDPQFARHLYAGGDILLMPSRYEPCGLAQMIAMRYGCVTLARATGGLKDTIVDFDQDSEGTGFLFPEATHESFLSGLDRAVRNYGNQDQWQKIQLNGMKQDFSWQRSAQEYVKLYHQLTSSHAA